MRQATVKSSNTFYVGVADQLFGCQLQPIIQMAEKFGIKSFYRPAAEPRTDVAQSILNYQSATRLTLGDIETSPLELTSAYAAVANDGRYNTPVPIKSVTANNGDPIRVPRTAGRQVVSPEVAREAVDILKGDTHFGGTSADAFASWYAQHPGTADCRQDRDRAGPAAAQPRRPTRTARCGSRASRRTMRPRPR